METIAGRESGLKAACSRPNVAGTRQVSQGLRHGLLIQNATTHPLTAVAWLTEQPRGSPLSPSRLPLCLRAGFRRRSPLMAVLCRKKDSLTVDRFALSLPLSAFLGKSFQTRPKTTLLIFAEIPYFCYH